jgi:cysteine synthase A
VRTGPTHTEVKIDADGTVRIIETHTRLAGGFIPEMVRAVTDIDLYALTVQEACGELHSLPEPDRRPIAAALKYKRHHPGRVISVRGETYMRFRPDVLAHSVKIKPGVMLRKPESNFERTDFVACHAPTLAEAYTLCDHYLKYLAVEAAR